jgi:lysophospholipase L1-like esterase
MSKKKELFFFLILIVLMLLFVEAALRILGIAVPKVEVVVDSGQIPITRTDPILGIRPNHMYPGHDAQGFRNENVPEKAEVVALGDSQTYGMGVRRNAAWPRQLSRFTGESVYNMAFGSYGPLHSLALFPEAMRLQPRFIIEAFYSGNDLFDAYQLVYGEGAHSRWKKMKSQDEAVLAAIQRAEAQETLLSKALRLTNQVHAPKERRPEARKAGGKRSFLSRHSRIVRVVELLAQKLSSSPAPQTEQKPAAIQTSKSKSELFFPFEHGAWRTVFNPSYRLLALDRKDPRIKEGFRLCLEGMRRMAQLAREHDTRFAVLLIPTKELVFKHVVEAALGDNIDLLYLRLLEVEELVLADVKDFLTAEGIPVIDCRDSLRESLESGPQPYRTSSDGHPAPYGHKAIAREVARRLEPARKGEK